MHLQIEHQWIDCGPSVDQLSHATMAEVGIYISEVALTSHVNTDSRIQSERVVVPLYQIAEWAAAWWWAMFWEYGRWGAEDNDYLSRHDIQRAATGFCFPGVFFRPTGDWMDVEARRYKPRHTAIEYLTSGQYRVPLIEVKQEFARIIEVTLARLQDDGLLNTDLQRDWDAINSLDAEARSFCVAAGRFGLDPFDLLEEEAAAIEKLLERVPEHWRADLFSLGSPRAVYEEYGALNAAAEELTGMAVGPKWNMKRGSEAPSPNTAAPWQVGFEAARTIREALGLNGGPLDFTGDFAIETIDLYSSFNRLSAVVAQDSPSCAVTARSSSARRFAQARAVGEHLMGSYSTHLITKMKTEDQARNRSFAAELLAPSLGLRDRIGDSFGKEVSTEAVESLAEEFAVSELVIKHQIENHQLGLVEDL